MNCPPSCPTVLQWFQWHTSHSWPSPSAESPYMCSCCWHSAHLLQYLSASTPRSSFYISLHCQNDVAADLHKACSKLARNSAKWEYLHTRWASNHQCSWKTWRPSAGQQRCGQWVLIWLVCEELIQLFLSISCCSWHAGDGVLLLHAQQISTLISAGWSSGSPTWWRRSDHWSVVEWLTVSRRGLYSTWLLCCRG